MVSQELPSGTGIDVDLKYQSTSLASEFIELPEAVVGRIRGSPSIARQRQTSSFLHKVQEGRYEPSFERFDIVTCSL